MKKFNIVGICSPKRHYMVDTSKKIDEIIGLIDDGVYFTINRPRQYGKTNTLYLLKQRIKNSHYVLSTTFQSAAQEDFASAPAFVKFFLGIIRKCMISAGCSENMISSWMDLSTADSGQDSLNFEFLRGKIDMLCRTSDRPIVLIIDEADAASSNDIFVRFLAMLRDNYLLAQQEVETAFQSVILAGITDIKNMKLKIRPEEEHAQNSPWNIAVDFTVDMSFSVEEIAGMLQEYEADHKTGMDIMKMSVLLREYTSGYPFLVSRLCKLMDEKIIGSPRFPTYSSVWTREGFLAAEKRLLEEKNTLFDDLIKQIEDHPDLDKLLYGILFEGLRRPYNPDNNLYQRGSMYGFLAKRDTDICISNRIFQTRFYNYYLDKETLDEELSESAQSLKAQFTTHGRLNMDLVLTKFHEHFKSVGLSNSDVEKFVEKMGERCSSSTCGPLSTALATTM